MNPLAAAAAAALPESTLVRRLAALGEQPLTELVFSTRADGSAPKVLLLWRRQRGTTRPALPHAELLADARTWGIPSPVLEAALARFMSYPQGSALYLRPPREPGDGCALYLELGQASLLGQFLADGSLATLWPWVHEHVVAGNARLAEAAALAADAAARNRNHGVLFCWNVEHHQVVSRDLYLGVSGSQRNTIAGFLPLLGEELAPALEVLGAKGNGNHASQRCRLFLKVGGGGDASVHARSPVWEAVAEVAGAFGATEFVEELRGRFTCPPDVFCVGRAASGRYGSAYYFWPR